MSIYVGLGCLTNSISFSYSNKDRNIKNDSKVFTSYKIQKPMKIILDIDDVIVRDFHFYGDAKNVHVNKMVQKIGQDSIIESCGRNFYLYNGWKELIKYVMKLTNNHLVFFSNGAKERNEDIVPKILARVLEKDATEYVNDHVQIFSREHTLNTYNMEDRGEKQYQPSGMWVTNKKDLTVIVNPEELKDTILIDDDHSYVIKGQERNLLNLRMSRIFASDLTTCTRLSSKDSMLLDESKIMCDKEFFFNFNKLFYAVGVLYDVCTKHSKSKLDLVDIMYADHGTKHVRDYSTNPPSTILTSYKLCKRFKLYKSGLEVLSEINSDIGFFVNK